MFDFIRKADVWRAQEGGLEREIGALPHFQLKSMQDLAVFGFLRGATGKDIAEIGAGHSRLLPHLARENRCVSVEKFEGAGGGPKEQHLVPGTRHVSAFLGEHHSELAADAFDIVYSISVVEHVPTPNLAHFHKDQLRILRPGGVFIHAIDVYIADGLPDHHVQRLDRYRDWVVNTLGVMPVGPVLTDPLVFTCDLASNPDNVMYMWKNLAPALAELRERAQCVSLMVAGRKVEDKTDEALQSS